jgi:hypothetical protein
MKNVLLIGPSKYALEDFDYSIMKNYEKIARINKYLETKDSGRCDIIFLNSNCVKFYLKKPHALAGKKIYVKRRQESYLLKKKLSKLDVEDMEKFWQIHIKYFQPHQPYYGTLAMNFLRKRFESVDVAGFDFYYNGFSKKEDYLDGYYDLKDLKKEDPQHSIKKDIQFIKRILENDNLNLIHRTKQIFEEIKNG